MSANATPGTNVWTNYSGPSKFSSAPPTSNRSQTVPADNAVLTQDFTGRAAATPNAANDQTSPLALSGATTVQTIVIPPNATKVTLIGSAAFNVSEYWTGSGALTQYAAIPASTPITLELARQQNLYVEGTGNLTFIFQTL